MAVFSALSLFVIASSVEVDYSKLPVRDEYYSASVDFEKCVTGTSWATEYEKVYEVPVIGQGLTCAEFSDDNESVCQTYGDAAHCCKVDCRSDHVCATPFKDTKSEPVDSYYTETTLCMALTYFPPWYIFWKWFTSWQRVKYNSCKKIRDRGYKPEDYPVMQMCCPDDGTAEAGKKLKESYKCDAPPVDPETGCNSDADCSNDAKCTNGKCVDQDQHHQDQHHCSKPAKVDPNVVGETSWPESMEVGATEVKLACTKGSGARLTCEKPGYYKINSHNCFDKDGLRWAGAGGAATYGLTALAALLLLAA